MDTVKWKYDPFVEFAAPFLTICPFMDDDDDANILNSLKVIDTV